MEHLGERWAPGTDGVAAKDAGAIPTGQAAGREAELVLRLDRPMTERLESEGLAGVYEDMEMPLVEVLAGLERAGVKIDTSLLAAMSRDMEAQLQVLTKDIHRLAKGERDRHALGHVDTVAAILDQHGAIEHDRC